MLCFAFLLPPAGRSDAWAERRRGGGSRRWKATRTKTFPPNFSCPSLCSSAWERGLGGAEGHFQPPARPPAPRLLSRPSLLNGECSAGKQERSRLAFGSCRLSPFGPSLPGSWRAPSDALLPPTQPAAACAPSPRKGRVLSEGPGIRAPLLPREEQSWPPPEGRTPGSGVLCPPVPLSTTHPPPLHGVSPSLFRPLGSRRHLEGGQPRTPEGRGRSGFTPGSEGEWLCLAGSLLAPGDPWPALPGWRLSPMLTVASESQAVWRHLVLSHCLALLLHFSIEQRPGVTQHNNNRRPRKWGEGKSPIPITTRALTGVGSWRDGMGLRSKERGLERAIASPLLPRLRLSGPFSSPLKQGDSGCNLVRNPPGTSPPELDFWRCELSP